MAGAIDLFKCFGCGSPDVDGIDEHGLSHCSRCLEHLKGYAEGEAEAAELMLHLAVAGARAKMRDDEKVRRVFEHVMGGGEPRSGVRGVGS